MWRGHTRAWLILVVKYDNITIWMVLHSGWLNPARRVRSHGLLFKGDAFRVIYALQIGEEIWVVHAFQKKSTQGIKTPKREIDLVKERLKRLKEMLR